MSAPKYDVAISFLSADLALATALADKLSDGLKLFFYPRSQEDLAGKNGLEAMRLSFLPAESRIVVVLYRDTWGETPWTRIESTAIQEGCLGGGWERLFFVMVDKSSKPPKWLPTTQIRLNFPDFGIEQAVGAIKARAQEAGSVIKPLAPAERAQLARRETEYVNERAQLRSVFGASAAKKAAVAVFESLRKVCAELNAEGSLTIEFSGDAQGCHLRNRVSLRVGLSTYGEAELVVREFDKRQPMRGENLWYPDGEPQLVRQTKFLPDLNRAREVGWSAEGSEAEFLTPAALAETIANMFIGLVAKAERGQLGGGLD
jgi:hypothetical protein